MTQFNVPKGWALMPMEATPEMEQAAEKYWNERRFKSFSADPRTWQGVYAAMRAAAPAAPVAQAVAITEKQVMTAYFSASRLHISGTSNWAAAFAQSLNGQIAAPPAQPDASVLSILREARESVDYHKGMQNLGWEAGKRHAAELASLIERIDAVLAGKGGGE